MSPQLRSSRLGEIVPALRALYRTVDRDVARFQRNTGLQCSAGCGHCCENPQVETTAEELFPLALYLYQTGQGESVLRRCAAVKGKDVCVFYSPAQPLAPGCCSVYLLRPLLCRLFGFSTITDKHGRPVLVTCPSIKKDVPAAVERAQQHIARGRQTPMMSFYIRQLLAINPSLNKEQVPINSAMEHALRKVGIILDYSQQSQRRSPPNA